MTRFEELLQTDIEGRDQAWESAFLEELPKAPVKVLSPDPQEGPDYWPYLLVEAGNEAASDNDSVENVVAWLSERGIGLAINPTKPSPDYVMTYGMIWNYRERGQFITPQETKPKAGLFEVKDGQQLWVGAPSAQFLPTYARSVLKQFLLDQGMFAPKCLMVSNDNVNFDLCFSIESLKSPPPAEHSNIAEAISWFLPAHYSVSLLSEKAVSGFVPL